MTEIKYRTPESVHSNWISSELVELFKVSTVEHKSTINFCGCVIAVECGIILSLHCHILIREEFVNNNLK